MHKPGRLRRVDGSASSAMRPAFQTCSSLAQAAASLVGSLANEALGQDAGVPSHHRVVSPTASRV